MDGAHTQAQYAFVCASVGIRDTPGRSSLRLETSGVARRKDGGRGRNKEVTRVATGTRPTAFKLKTITNPGPLTDKMKPHGKYGMAALMRTTCAHAACTDATLLMHTLTRYTQIRESTTGEPK